MWTRAIIGIGQQGESTGFGHRISTGRARDLAKLSSKELVGLLGAAQPLGH